MYCKQPFNIKTEDLKYVDVCEKDTHVHIKVEKSHILEIDLMVLNENPFLATVFNMFLCEVDGVTVLFRQNSNASHRPLCLPSCIWRNLVSWNDSNPSATENLLANKKGEHVFINDMQAHFVKHSIMFQNLIADIANKARLNIEGIIHSKFFSPYLLPTLLRMIKIDELDFLVRSSQYTDLDKFCVLIPFIAYMRPQVVSRAVSAVYFFLKDIFVLMKKGCLQTDITSIKQIHNNTTVLKPILFANTIYLYPYVWLFAILVSKETSHVHLFSKQPTHDSISKNDILVLNTENTSSAQNLIYTVHKFTVSRNTLSIKGVHLCVDFDKNCLQKSDALMHRAEFKISKCSDRQYIFTPSILAQLVSLATKNINFQKDATDKCSLPNAFFSLWSLFEHQNCELIQEINSLQA